MGLSITIFTPKSSPRLSFVLDWLFKEQLGLAYELVHEKPGAGSFISYGSGDGTISIYNVGLLWKNDRQPQIIDTGEWRELFTLYPETNPSSTIPFDLFSAIFYLLSRYEEYLRFEPDQHGRYPHSESILRDVLARPVVDEWVEMLRQLLEEKWEISIPQRSFKFLPTYDIDIAWSYRHKGPKRWLGAAIKEIISGRFASFIARCKVALGISRDPYDAFNWMKKLHQHHNLEPRFFILSALNASDFDKNISPAVPAMKALVKRLHRAGKAGIHPSYITKDNPDELIKEKEVLQSIIGETITTSRQHFIRLFFPDTYRMLLACGIEDDFSMGYSTSLGFRAGTSHSFLWYDLQKECTTTLRLHPFCFMDTTAHYDRELSVSEAFTHLKHLQQNLEKCGGTLTTIFHNFSLGTDKEWDGWGAAYVKFIAGTKIIDL